MHLGIPEPARRSGSSFHRLISQDAGQVAETADLLTRQAGRGRLTGGAWVFEHRNSVAGHVHVAGEWWKNGGPHNSAGSSSSQNI